MKGVLCLGEALIDFIPLDSDNSTYQKAPGGAPANVSVGVSKLGGKAAFIGKVGDDVLGRFLKDTLKGYGVHTQYMKLTDEARTGITFVTLEPSGERDFSFYINPSADSFLNKDEIDWSIFEEYKIFHFGSISLIHEPSRTAALQAVKRAREKNMLISYDPNLRLGLWGSEERAKAEIMATLPYADILKISEEELTFLTGCNDMEEGISRLPENQLTIVTLGSDGCIFRYKDEIGKVPTLPYKVVDTTGAGDAFVSGLLYCINESPKALEEYSHNEMAFMIRFANVSGGLAVTRKGAMTGLPCLDEVQDILKKA
ncbi:aminoimidazole riboside kinase [Cytobacillus oceanisediminis]|uniref:Fructokinase n=1 Tax=Cytobacillus oceanisediminis TaxID=665099 RepID=A0ABX3CNW1_9BACI|nr:aminoimidazole riboside kinase [Cytobacillus oceanisediminis]OHX45829.1 fructokinase [Cytobacillus oceanisediminis]